MRPLYGPAELDALERLIEERDLESASRLADTISSPTDAESAWRLARALDVGLDRAGEAEPLYRLAVPERLDALVDLSLSLDERGREEEAERELKSQPAERESAARVVRGRHYRAHNYVS